MKKLERLKRRGELAEFKRELVEEVLSPTPQGSVIFLPTLLHASYTCAHSADDKGLDGS